MDALKAYCYSLIVITVCSAVVMLIVPEKNGIKKYVRWLTALSVTATLIIPLKDIGTDIKIDISTESFTTSDDKKSGHELIICAFNNEIKDAVINAVTDRFKLICDDVDADISYDEKTNTVSLEIITLSINNRSEFLHSDLKRYLKDLFVCDIEVKGENE